MDVVKISGLPTGAAGNHGTGWHRLARRRPKMFGVPLSREWNPEVTFLCSRWDGYKRSYASDAGWERDGNCYTRGMGTAVVELYMEREFQTTWHGNGK